MLAVLQTWIYWHNSCYSCLFTWTIHYPTLKISQTCTVRLYNNIKIVQINLRNNKRPVFSIPDKQVHWIMHYSVKPVAFWWLDSGALLKPLCWCFIVLLGGQLIVSWRPGGRGGVGLNCVCMCEYLCVSVCVCVCVCVCWRGLSVMTFSWMTGVAGREEQNRKRNWKSHTGRLKEDILSWLIKTKQN